MRSRTKQHQPCVAEAMSQGLWTAAPDMTVRQAAILMATENLAVLTIEGKQGKAVGILTTAAVSDAAARSMGDLPVTAIMEPLHEVCHPADGLDMARGMMATLGTALLPVCDAAGRPLGLISRHGMEACAARTQPPARARASRHEATAAH